MARTLLLDLDGTLVDTVPDLAAALNRLMRTRGLPDLSSRAGAAMVGDGVAVLVARAFAAHGRQPDATAVAEHVCRLYGACRGREQAVSAGAAGAGRAGPSRLAPRGLHQQAGTGRPKLAAGLGLLPLMCAVGGGDSFPARKPDPAHLLGTLARAGVRPTRR